MRKRGEKNMLREQLEKYVPYNEQEEKDKDVMISYLDNFQNSLTRDNKYGHFYVFCVGCKQG